MPVTEVANVKVTLELPPTPSHGRGIPVRFEDPPLEVTDVDNNDVALVHYVCRTNDQVLKEPIPGNMGWDDVVAAKFFQASMVWVLFRSSLSQEKSEVIRLKSSYGGVQREGEYFRSRLVRMEEEKKEWEREIETLRGKVSELDARPSDQEIIESNCDMVIDEYKDLDQYKFELSHVLMDH